MNTEEIRKQTVVLDDLRKQQDKYIESRNKVLAVNCGQQTASISIAGTSFSITELNNCYTPAVVKGRENIQAECAACLQAIIDTLSSKIIGAENKLKRLTSNNT